MIETPFLERPGETEHGMHIAEDKYVSPEVVIEKSKHDKIQDKKDNSCDVCNKKFKSVNFPKNHDMKYHIKQGSQNIYKCDNCNKTFSDKTQLQGHIKKEHEVPSVSVKLNDCPWLVSFWKSYKHLRVRAVFSSIFSLF